MIAKTEREFKENASDITKDKAPARAFTKASGEEIKRPASEKKESSKAKDDHAQIGQVLNIDIARGGAREVRSDILEGVEKAVDGFQGEFWHGQTDSGN